MVTQSRRGRRDNWTAALILRFPLARAVGFECFRGWRPLLGRLLERLERAIAEQPPEAQAEFRIIQIKQKFGRLRVYLSTTATPEMRAAIDEAEEESIATCEVCSAPGRLADRNGWTSVKCTDHENWSRLDGVF
jgi:hypothetical protein